MKPPFRTDWRKSLQLGISLSLLLLTGRTFSHYKPRPLSPFHKRFGDEHPGADIYYPESSPETGGWHGIDLELALPFPFQPTKRRGRPCLFSISSELPLLSAYALIWTAYLADSRLGHREANSGDLVRHDLVLARRTAQPFFIINSIF